MHMPKQFQDKPVTQDLVASMTAIVGSRRGQETVAHRGPYSEAPSRPATPKTSGDTDKNRG